MQTTTNPNRSKTPQVTRKQRQVDNDDDVRRPSDSDDCVHPRLDVEKGRSRQPPLDLHPS